MKYNLDNLCEEREEFKLIYLEQGDPQLRGISEYELTQLKQELHLAFNNLIPPSASSCEMWT